jgi:hypothetical protein
VCDGESWQSAAFGIGHLTTSASNSNVAAPCKWPVGGSASIGFVGVQGTNWGAVMGIFQAGSFNFVDGPFNFGGVFIGVAGGWGTPVQCVNNGPPN